MDRHYDIVDANESSGIFTAGCAPHLLKPPINVLRLTLHPDGLAERFINLSQWRAHLLGRLRREVESSGDPQLAALYAELRGYPATELVPEVGQSTAADICMPMRIRVGASELSFYSTIATFGTPLDVTVAELSIESFFPADAPTAAALAGTKALQAL
jgi:hypothetical protein